jgi:hypothetical protein
MAKESGIATPTAEDLVPAGPPPQRKEAYMRRVKSDAGQGDIFSFVLSAALDPAVSSIA